MPSNFRTVHYSDFVMPLVKAVHELNVKLAADNVRLKAQIALQQEPIEKIKQQLIISDQINNHFRRGS